MPRPWRPETELVHGGTIRSPFGETSEALFLNSGFTYESAHDAERRFRGDDDGYIYTRYSNPTLTMFETRMALLEGAETARALNLMNESYLRDAFGREPRVSAETALATLTDIWMAVIGP